VFVFPGNPNGTLAAPGYLPIQAVGLSVADFNHDGNVDIATGSTNVSGSKTFAEIRSGDGSGAFPIMPTTRFQTRWYMVRAADVDGDGKPDLLTQVAGPPGSPARIGLYRNTTP
jgi:hypothetical protein